jgi:hypothetical protein
LIEQIYNHATQPRRQARMQRACQGQRRRDVHAHMGLETVQGKIGRRIGHELRGVVDQTLDRTECSLARGKQPVDLSRQGKVKFDRVRAPSQGADALDGGQCLILGAVKVDRHIPSVLRQGQGDRTPDALGAPGHQRDAPGRIQCRL